MTRCLIRIVSTAVFLHAFAFCQIGVTPTDDVSLTVEQDPKFHPGDVWEYHTRPGEEKSRLIILKVEKSATLVIVHVSVSGVRLANCLGGPEPDKFEHMPFAREALDASVTKRVAENQPLPDYQEGYGEWKAGYLRKRAGVYTISVADAVKAAEYTFRSNLSCPTATLLPK